MMKMMQLRKRKGITQAELAERCETTQQTIAKIEKGLVDPKLSTLNKIAEALDCELAELFFTKSEFVSQINSVIKEQNVDVKKSKIIGLNYICASEKQIPSFHPYWEKIVISNGHVKLKEEK
jgi:transcriptional regulator with XRE-family HTH domain